jgi:hypothetical protein
LPSFGTSIYSMLFVIGHVAVVSTHKNKYWIINFIIIIIIIIIIFTIIIIIIIGICKSLGPDDGWFPRFGDPFLKIYEGYSESNLRLF